MAHGFPKVFVAAVGEAMTEMCGEVADGLLAHAFTTKRYFEEVTTPALLRGMERSGRKRSEFQLSCPLFVVTGNDDAELAANAAARASRSPSTPRRLRIARFSNCTAGATCRPNCTDCHWKASWDADGFADRRRDPATSSPSSPRSTSCRGTIRERCDGVIDRVLVGFPVAPSTRPP